jgi:hypothetical protein
MCGQEQHLKTPNGLSVATPKCQNNMKKKTQKQIQSQEDIVPTQPKESWEETLRILLQNSEVTKGTRKAVEGLISTELAKEYKRGRHDNIIDISTWKNIGIKKGYFDFLLREPINNLIKGL